MATFQVSSQDVFVTLWVFEAAAERREKEAWQSLDRQREVWLLLLTESVCLAWSVNGGKFSLTIHGNVFDDVLFKQFDPCVL